MTANQNQPNSSEKLNALLFHHSIRLTSKELKVLCEAITGKTNSEIAVILGVATCTIKTHKNNLISKIGVEGKAGFQKFLLEVVQNLR